MRIYTKTYFDDCDNFLSWYKVIPILNIVNYEYELLYINGKFFDDKVNEFRLEDNFHFLEKNRTQEYYDRHTYYGSTEYKKAVFYFYYQHTGLDLSDIENRIILRRKKNKGSNSFFNISINVTVIDRPYTWVVWRITDAIKLLLKTKDYDLSINVLNSVLAWSQNQPYKQEKYIYDEIRKALGFNTKLGYNSLSDYNIDYERLSELYINQINKI